MKQKIKTILFIVMALLIVCLTPNCFAAEEDIVEITDYNLKNHLINGLDWDSQYYDRNGDGKMSVTEMEQIYSLELTFVPTDFSAITTYMKNLSYLAFRTYATSDFSGIEILADLENLNSLTIEYVKTESLEKLESLTNITNLSFGYMDITDVSTINKLTNLKELYIYNCKNLTDISCLDNLTNLEKFSISATPVEDASVVSNFTKLRELNLANNKLKAVPDLSKITNFADMNSNIYTAIYLASNEITDLSGFNGTNFEHIDISYNKVQNVTGFSNMPRLESIVLRDNEIDTVGDLPDSVIHIDFSNNKLSNLNFLSGVPNLERLYVSGNDLTDISGVESLQETLLNFDASANKITDASVLSKLTNIEYINLANTEITDLDVSDLTRLINLYCNNCKLKTVNFENATSLTNVYIQNNNISDISTLEGLENLAMLNMSTNPISNISPISNTTARYIYLIDSLVNPYDEATFHIMCTWEENGITYLLGDCSQFEPSNEESFTTKEIEEVTIGEEKVTVMPTEKKTTVEEILTASNFPVIDTYTIKVLDASGNEKSSTDKVGSRNVIQITDEDGTVLAEYTVVVEGDINGDGETRIFDSFQILKDILISFGQELDAIEMMIRDFNNDGYVRIYDAFQYLKQAIFG